MPNEELKIQIASLDPEKYHIIGVNCEVDRLSDIYEYLRNEFLGLKFLLVPTNDIGMVDVHSLTDDQVKILSEQLSKIKQDKETTS